MLVKEVDTNERVITHGESIPINVEADEADVRAYDIDAEGPTMRKGDEFILFRTNIGEAKLELVFADDKWQGFRVQEGNRA